MTKSEAYRQSLERAKAESTLQLLFRCARLVEARARQQVAERPGRPQLKASHTALFPHVDLDGTRITVLAERLGVTKQAVSQTVADLERLGLLELVPDPEDGRAKRVRFTAKGKRGLLDGVSHLRDYEAALETEVGAAKLTGLREGLLAILKTLE